MQAEAAAGETTLEVQTENSGSEEADAVPEAASIVSVQGGQGSLTVFVKAPKSTYTGYQIQCSKSKDFSSGVKAKTMAK